ncbi:MAG: hypothetical protein U9R14_03495 [Patescibacteria group bacterium]|nr:hypothetical protein [Patescibacteria group bacterium]
MVKLEEIFNKIQNSKKEQREIKAIYKDALTNSEEYKKIIEKINELKEEKKKIEENTKSDFSSEFAKLDSLKTDIESDEIILADIAINQLMKGEAVEIIDDYDNKYEPIFSVKFKKLL